MTDHTKSEKFLKKLTFCVEHLVTCDYIVAFMAAGLSKTRTQKRAGITRRKLQKAALNVFTEKGIEATTVEEITEKADLGKGTLYRHFADKEEIVITLVEEAIGHLIECLQSHPAEPETLEDVLEHLLNAHYDFLIHNTEEFILLFQGRVMLKLQCGTAEELEGPYSRYLQELENQISDYVSPKINRAKIRRLAYAIAGFIFGFFLFAMVSMDADEIETSIKPLREAFVKSLCVFLGRE